MTSFKGTTRWLPSCLYSQDIEFNLMKSLIWQ